MFNIFFVIIQFQQRLFKKKSDISVDLNFLPKYVESFVCFWHRQEVLGFC